MKESFVYYSSGELVYVGDLPDVYLVSCVMTRTVGEAPNQKHDVLYKIEDLLTGGFIKTSGGSLWHRQGDLFKIQTPATLSFSDLMCKLNGVISAEDL